MKSKCRIWWPANLLPSTQPQSSVVLFGWFLPSSSTSLDIVFAFACNEASLSTFGSDVQGILHMINEKMPVVLQDKCMLSILGYLAVDPNSNGQIDGIEVKKKDQFNYPAGHSHVRRICGCYSTDGFLEYNIQSYIQSNWIQLVYGSTASCRKSGWIPKLHHIHWNGQLVSQIDLHVVIYEIPKFGSHHFSVSFSGHSENRKAPLRKPKWVEDLQQSQPLLELDPVLLAINCVISAESLFQVVSPDRSTSCSHIMSMLVTLTWKLLAVSVACVSTFVYVILQFLHFLGSNGSASCIYKTSTKLFSHTWQNIRVRCCQILYWPISFQSSAVRSGSCVEYAEKASLRNHSMWSAVAIDVLLGNLIGIALLIYAESACQWVSTIANNYTTYWLRISCARLMGNPAGFKLNTELARVLGMISLNSIQIWSTLWVLVGSLFIYIIKGLAISGVLFGLTTFAALVRDMISILTLHVSALHWFISLLYSQQIRAIAAFWRLFRGQKWNPLRQRLDSYDYSVEQHIVGSLVFTPLLLLLPTTSAFYIFFTIMNSTINVICMIIEVSISVIHATPYNKVLLWLVSPSRFPGGIWFEVLSTEHRAISSSEIKYVDKTSLQSPRERIEVSSTGSDVLTSYLHSHSLSIAFSTNAEVSYKQEKQKVLTSCTAQLSLLVDNEKLSGRTLDTYILQFQDRLWLHQLMEFSVEEACLFCFTISHLLKGLVSLPECHGCRFLTRIIGSFAMMLYLLASQTISDDDVVNEKQLEQFT